MRLDLDGTPDDPDLMRKLAAESEGKFNYKYIQAVPEKGVDVAKGGVDASYPVFNPKAWQAPEGYAFALKKPETQMCSGTVTFHKPAPEDMRPLPSLPRSMTPRLRASSRIVSGLSSRGSFIRMAITISSSKRHVEMRPPSLCAIGSW